jgi:YihY family inner membrane protein
MAVSKKIVAFILFSYQHFMKTCCLTRAGSLAFTTIIAIVPLMVVGLSVIAFLPISQLVQTHIQNFIFSNFLVSSANVILDYVDLFVARVHMLSLVQCYLARQCFALVVSRNIFLFINFIIRPIINRLKFAVELLNFSSDERQANQSVYHERSYFYELLRLSFNL